MLNLHHNILHIPHLHSHNVPLYQLTDTHRRCSHTQNLFEVLVLIFSFSFSSLNPPIVLDLAHARGLQQRQRCVLEYRVVALGTSHYHDLLRSVPIGHADLELEPRALRTFDEVGRERMDDNDFGHLPILFPSSSHSRTGPAHFFALTFSGYVPSG